MKTGDIEVIKPIVRTANWTNLSCNRNNEYPVITETDLKFTKISLR